MRKRPFKDLLIEGIAWAWLYVGGLLALYCGALLLRGLLEVLPCWG